MAPDISTGWVVKGGSYDEGMAATPSSDRDGGQPSEGTAEPRSKISERGRCNPQELGIALLFGVFPFKEPT